MSQMKHDATCAPISNNSSTGGCSKKHHELHHAKQTSAFELKTLSKIVDRLLDNDVLMIFGEQECNFSAAFQNKLCHFN